MHPEISMCLRLLARLNYIMGDYQEALYTQHKAVMMSERVLGIDHPQTATEYVSLNKRLKKKMLIVLDLDPYGTLFICKRSFNKCVEIALSC
jgi:hypothetical protein